MIKKGQLVKVKVDYQKNKRLCGEFTGTVTQVGCYRSGFAFFKLDSYPKLAFPNSSAYVKILDAGGRQH